MKYDIPINSLGESGADPGGGGLKGSMKPPPFGRALILLDELLPSFSLIQANYVNKPINSNGFSYNQLQLLCSVSSGILHGKNDHLVMSS